MKDVIAIIGTGNMGSAFYTGIHAHLNRVRINVCDRNQLKLDELDAEHEYTDPAKAILDADVVLLAVKPQSAQELLAPIARDLSDRLVISIMAGISVASLKKMEAMGIQVVQTPEPVTKEFETQAKIVAKMLEGKVFSHEFLTKVENLASDYRRTHK